MTVLFECGGLTVAMALNIEIKEAVTGKARPYRWPYGHLGPLKGQVV